MKIHTVSVRAPYYSQRLDTKRAFWRPRACGIASLKMAMDYVGRDMTRYKKVSLDTLIDLGVAIHARDPEHGWIHNGLVAIAKLNGFKKSYRKEWSLEARVDGTGEIVELISQGIPALASLKSRTGGHLVLITGATMKDEVCTGFLYHDPKATERSLGKNKKISIDTFLRSWKGRIIVVKR